MTIKFNKYHVTDGTTKARVSYSLDNRIDGRKVVTMYAKDYDHSLGAIFTAEAENETDSMTDYFETDTVRLFEDHPLYGVARSSAERFIAGRSAKFAASNS